MMNVSRIVGTALVAAVFVLPPGSIAQPSIGEGPASAHIASGIEAYRAEDFPQALRDFEAAAAAEPDNAEAHFLLARVLFDTPLRNESRAGDSIKRARELEPENLRYMVAELQQLRTDTWNFFQEMIRQSKRLSLAREILERDPENGFAHEEFGRYYIRDYWYYRNAVSLPGIGFYSPGAGTELPSEVGIGVESEDPTGFQSLDAPASAPFDLPDAGDLTGLADRFDIDALRAQNVMVLDLSGRADRAYESAVRHLEAAIRHDPRRRPVYDDMMRLYALAGEFEDALGMLGQMLVSFPDDEEMWRYLGLANHRLGRDDAASTSYREAFKLMSDEERAVFEDISLLLPEAEQAAYNAAPEAVAARFWTSQEPRFLTPYNERKIEHYVRLTYADLMYRSEDLGLPGWETQRGKIHVRYGVPQSDIVITGDFQFVLENLEGIDANSDRGGAGPAPFGRRLEETQSNRFNIWNYGDFNFVFEDPFNNGEFRLYSPPADLFGAVGIGAIERMDYELRARATFRETPERYDYTPPGRQIGIPYLVSHFKGSEGRTDLFVHYGIPISEEFEAGTTDLVDVTVKTGVFLISQARDVLVERRRTHYGLRSSQIERFEDTQLWTDTQAMEVPPGVHEVSVEFETVGGGTSAVQRREITVPDFSGSDLALSSLMLAYHVEDTDASSIPGQIIRDGLAIKPAPWSVFHHEQPIYLFFEIYNLSQNGDRTDYEVEAQLRPKDTSTGIARIARSIFGGGERGVSTQYPVQGNRRDDAQYVILDAAEQDPGLYTLTLKITDSVSGRSVEETTDLYLE